MIVTGPPLGVFFAGSGTVLHRTVAVALVGVSFDEPEPCTPN